MKLTPFCELKLLVGVGRVIKPLPGACSNEHINVFENQRDLHVAKLLEVVLYKIGVLKLRKVVMMTVIMLHVPGLGHHPVEPVIESAPEGTDCELEPMPAFFIGMALVITSMARVMSDHGPSGEGPG